MGEWDGFFRSRAHLKQIFPRLAAVSLAWLWNVSSGHAGVFFNKYILIDVDVDRQHWDTFH